MKRTFAYSSHQEEKSHISVDRAEREHSLSHGCIVYPCCPFIPRQLPFLFDPTGLASKGNLIKRLAVLVAPHWNESRRSRHTAAPCMPPTAAEIDVGNLARERILRHGRVAPVIPLLSAGSTRSGPVGEAAAAVLLLLLLIVGIRHADGVEVVPFLQRLRRWTALQN